MLQSNLTGPGEASGLIRRSDVAADIIQVAKAGGLPVSVKIRLGYTKVDEWKEWLTHILK
ncbi:tRNA-dihydrouridine synthase [Pullulanibacillus pueri]|nr:tRNA-dihydrouridine synthase [Pullulanibacillus pueri]